MRRKVALTAAAVAMVGTLAVGGTLAWFTDTETATNVVTLGNVDIVLNEDGEDSDERTSGVAVEGGLEYSNIMPGDTLPKDVEIALESGSNDAYVRAQITVSGDLLGLIGEDGDPSHIVTLKNGTDEITGWTKTDDGWVAIVEAPAKLEDEPDKNIFKVFDTVTFAGSEITNVYANKEDALKIKVEAQAIQADNFDDAKDAWAAFEANTDTTVQNPDAEGTIEPTTKADSNADFGGDLDA